MKTLFELFFTFFKIGSITFGGGLAMLPILEKELVQRKQWASSEELLDYYAISQSTPGVIAVNVSTFIGHKKKGIPGGIIATLGIITPSIIIITIIAEFISNFESILWVQKALKGINVSVAALLTYSVINLSKKTLKKWYSVIFFLTAFSLIYFAKVHSVFLILGAVIIGVILHFTLFKKKEDK
jgi:chromate transporter